MSIINFTVKFDALASLTDSADVGADADVVPLVGTATFTPVFSDEKGVLAPAYSPRPAIFKIRSFVGVVDTDGQLKASKGGSVGVRLWANDPVLELENLTYKVDFNLSTTLGEKVFIEGGYFSAPAIDQVINLADVLISTGSPSVSNLNQLQVYAHEIVDSTDVGVDLITAATPEAGRSAIQAARLGNPTGIKTDAYSASSGDIVLADVSSGGFTVTLPSAPTANTAIWVKKIDSSKNAVLIQRTGTDVFNTNNGPSTFQLATPGQSVAFQYLSGIWHVIANGTSLPGLDKRYFVKNEVFGTDRVMLVDSNGAPAIELNSTTGAVNRLWIVNAASGNAVELRSIGTDSNIPLVYRTKGNSAHYIQNSNGNNIAVFETISNYDSVNAVNCWVFQHSSTNNPIVMQADGNDSNIDIKIYPKGSGSVKLYSDNNYSNLSAQGPGSAAILSLSPKGTSAVQIGYSGDTGNTNYISVNGGATGSFGATISADGTNDANVNLNLTTKGSGSVYVNAIKIVDETSSQALSNKNLTSATNVFPTFNQNTTGSAAKWTTARNLAGNSVDGSANVQFANKFIVQGTSDSGLSAAQFLGALGTGLVKNTTATGVLSIASAGTDYISPSGTETLQNKTYSGGTMNGTTIRPRDTRDDNLSPFTYEGISHHLKANSADSLSDGGSYHGVLNLTHWADSSAGPAHQIGFTDNGQIWHRTHNGSSFSAWQRLIRSSGSIPSSNSATGKIGQIEMDSSYIYGCVAANTWKRIAWSSDTW